MLAFFRLLSTPRLYWVYVNHGRERDNDGVAREDRQLVRV